MGRSKTYIGWYNPGEVERLEFEFLTEIIHTFVHEFRQKQNIFVTCFPMLLIEHLCFSMSHIHLFNQL